MAYIDLVTIPSATVITSWIALTDYSFRLSPNLFKNDKGVVIGTSDLDTGEEIFLRTRAPSQGANNPLWDQVHDATGNDVKLYWTSATDNAYTIVIDQPGDYTFYVPVGLSLDVTVSRWAD